MLERTNAGANLVTDCWGLDIDCLDGFRLHARAVQCANEHRDADSQQQGDGEFQPVVRMKLQFGQ